MLFLLTIIVTVAICGFVHFNLSIQQSEKLMKKHIRNETFDVDDDENEVEEIVLADLVHESWITNLQTNERYYVSTFSTKRDFIDIPISEAMRLQPDGAYRAMIRYKAGRKIHDFFFKIKKTYRCNQSVILEYQTLDNIAVLAHIGKGEQT